MGVSKRGKDKVVRKISEFDLKDDLEDISEEHIVDRRELLEKFWKIATRYESLLHEKSSNR